MLPSKMFNLGNVFTQHFEIVPALSSTLREEVYRVRHQVYCEDLKFKPARADKSETDAHDANSLHLLIRSIKTGEFIGCTRIVVPRPGDPYYQLLFEKTCATVLDRSIIDPSKLPRHGIAEVSRLAAIAAFRRRKERQTARLAFPAEIFARWVSHVFHSSRLACISPRPNSHA